VGENESERDLGHTREVIVGQMRAALAGGALTTPAGLAVAYEPVWAIGTGRTPQPLEVADAHGAIREVLVQRFGPPGNAVRILYGGSVTAANARALLEAPGVDGALVGGASLAADEFTAIAAAATSC
jgi:triosephosphate isomerase